MAPVTSEDIAELSTIISENTRKVTEYLQQNGLPFPSFAVEAPTKSMIAPEASGIEDARLAVIDATRKLRNLMLGPQDYLQSFTVNFLDDFRGPWKLNISLSTMSCSVCKQSPASTLHPVSPFMKKLRSLKSQMPVGWTNKLSGVSYATP